MKQTISALALATLVSSISGAQASHNGVALGDQVRFKLAGISDPNIDKHALRCEGRVQGLLLDTAFVGPVGYCATRDLSSGVITEAQIGKRKGSRSNHMLQGLLLGGIAGGILGGLIAGDGCKKGGCDDGGLAIVEYMLVGLFSGSGIGAGIGLALPAGMQWRPIPAQFVRLDYATTSYLRKRIGLTPSAGFRIRFRRSYPNVLATELGR